MRHRYEARVLHGEPGGGVKYGHYEVIGRLDYRDHKPGETFVARLDRGAEVRAVARGNVRLIEIIEPALPDRYGLPDGWVPAANERGK